MRRSFIPCLLLVGLAFSACSRTPVRILPEITADMTCESKLDLPPDSPQPWILSNGATLLLVDPAGTIRRFDPRLNQVDALLDTRLPLEGGPLLQNGILVVGGGGRWALVDPAVMRVTKALPIDGITRPVAVAPGRLAGMGAKGLVLVDTEREKVLQTVPVGDFVDAQWRAGELLVLDGEVLRRFGPDGREQSLKIGFRPVSPFLLDGNNLYAGSADRELVKFSLSRRRVAWRRRLGMPLQLRPLKFDHFIVACPEDQNVWFFNSRGSVEWWQAQKSTRSGMAQAMTENLVVPLMNNQLMFLRPNTQRFNFFALPEGMSSDGAAAIAGAVYFLAPAAEDEHLQLQQAANWVDVETRLRPEGPVVAGTPLRMEFVLHNLLEPVLNVRLTDAGGAVRLQQAISSRQAPLLSWVAEQPGVMTLSLKAAANNTTVEHELKFLVIDPVQLADLPRLHF